MVAVGQQLPAVVGVLAGEYVVAPACSVDRRQQRIADRAEAADEAVPVVLGEVLSAEQQQRAAVEQRSQLGGGLLAQRGGEVDTEDLLAEWSGEGVAPCRSSGQTRAGEIAAPATSTRVVRTVPVRPGS